MLPVLRQIASLCPLLEVAVVYGVRVLAGTDVARDVAAVDQQGRGQGEREEGKDHDACGKGWGGGVYSCAYV